MSFFMNLTKKFFAKFFIWLSPLVYMLLACNGCTSIESTMVTRDEANHAWERHNCLNGIPITLKVPTHLKLYIYEKHFLEAITKEDDPKQLEYIGPVNLDVVVRDFAHEFMVTEKIFVVDFKRPPAGSANLRVDMTDEQYIAEIQHDITDQTIEQVSGLLGAFIGKGGNLASAANVEQPPASYAPDLTEINSLVAVGIFEIDAPDFEQKVQQFINCHLNKSHDAWVVPPCVNVINRVGIRPGDNLQVPYPPVPLCPGNSDWPPVEMRTGSTFSPALIDTSLQSIEGASITGDPLNSSYLAPQAEMQGSEL
jgi:hypothetical protein